MFWRIRSGEVPRQPLPAGRGVRLRPSESCALVLLVAADDVAAPGRRRPVLLALQVPVHDVAEDLGATRIADDLDAAADAVVIRPQVGAVVVVLDVAAYLAGKHRRAPALLDLDAAAHARGLAHDDLAGILGLDVADHAHAVGLQRGIALHLDRPLHGRPIEDARRALRHAQVVHRDRTERAATGAFL